MDLRSYLKTKPRGEAQRLADALGTSQNMIHQLSGGHRMPSRARALEIERLTDGAVTLYDWQPSATQAA